MNIGAALPLSGSASAVGQAVADGLRDVLDAVNAGGGVHGRQVRLITADTASHGTLAAIHSLLDKPVFALTASIWQGDDQDAERLLTERRVPNLASLVVRLRASDASAWDADLFPPLEEQQAVLAAAMERCEGPGERIALAVGPFGSKPASIRWVASEKELAAELQRAGQQGCVGFGLAAASLSPSVPAGWRQRIVLPMPAALLGETQTPWRQVGKAAGRVLVELLSVSGAMPNEHSALDALPSLLGFEPAPGLALGFNRTRRHGWNAETIAVPPRLDRAGIADESGSGPDRGG